MSKHKMSAIKNTHTKAAGLSQVIDPPSQVWQYIAMDLLWDCLFFSRYIVIIVLIDRSTKPARFGIR